MNHHPHAHHSHGGHAHVHAAHTSAARPLLAALLLTALFMLVELSVGLYSGSLSLLADAGHMLSDTGALGLALAAQSLAQRPRSFSASYGYRRAEVLAAFLNGIVLALIALWVAKEAAERWLAPSSLKPVPVLFVAALGLLLNLWVARRLHDDAAHNINVRAAVAHVLSDALGSVGVLISASVVYLFGWQRADAVVSFAIAALIAWSGWRILQHTAGVLLESVPPGVDLGAVQTCIERTPGVSGCHDLHVWRISDGFDAVSVHVTLQPDAHGVAVSQAVRQRIVALLGIEHVTVQPEAEAPREVVALRQSREGPPLVG